MPTAIAIRQIEGKPGQVWYPLDRIDVPSTTPSATQVTVRISAAALNHRDVFLRQHLYPGTTFGVPLLADGAGLVTATGSDPSARRWAGKRVILNPGTGWKDSPEGPESPRGYAILGGTKFNPVGTLAEEVTVEAGELEEAPTHLSAVEAAALPLTGLTAWRAVVTKSGNAAQGRNILVTGIGGGVALMALLFATAKGANVYVSSGSEEKLRKAKELGAKGGVNYKEEGWETKLAAMLPAGSQLDAIIDGAGGDVVSFGAKLLKVRTPSSSWLLTANDPPARRRHRVLRHDARPQDAVPHVGRAQEHRHPRVDHGFAQGVCRHGSVCQREEPQARHLAGRVRHRQFRRH